jgi:hypothetical protein
LVIGRRAQGQFNSLRGIIELKDKVGIELRIRPVYTPSQINSLFTVHQTDFIATSAILIVHDYGWFVVELQRFQGRLDVFQMADICDTRHFLPMNSVIGPEIIEYNAYLAAIVAGAIFP